jgi:methionyl-tRNA synthetase
VQHLIGKDILKPHAIYWPCMLKAAGLPVFTGLNVHGYWNVGGGKMSKSIGNVVEALALTDKYGHDAFRYFVMREMVFGLDADFSEEAFVGRLNADLANDLGNLVSRATTLVVNGGGIARVPAEAELDEGARDVRGRAGATVREVEAAMAEFALQRALAAIWAFIGAVNGYIDTTQPWAMARDPAQQPRLEVVLYTLAESLRFLGVVLAPFLPEASGRIRAALGQAGEPRLAEAAWGGLPAGAPVRKLSGLFPRIDTGKTPGGAARAGASRPDRAQAVAGPAAPAAGPAAAEGGTPGRIPIADFARLDLRVALVQAAEALPRSRKLLKLTVSLGTEARTVVAGIAEHYRPEDLVGKKIVIVANLEPARLMGVESQGMLLAGSEGDRLAVLTPDRDLPPGARVK